MFGGITIEVVVLVTEPYTDYQLRVRAETGGGYSNYSTLYQAVTDVTGKLEDCRSSPGIFLIDP